MNNILEIVKKIEKASHDKNTDYFCNTRDIFQARLDSFITKTNEYLLSAIIGEIGNNTFDHNWDYQIGQSRGVYFNLDKINQIILADFGRGLQKSLESVTNCKTDLEAIKIAFTKNISGRAPEQRGNGLKFVSETIKQKYWKLYFQSGIACCIIENQTINFFESDFSFIGCLAIIETGEK